MMISIWHLFWICPLFAVLGFIYTSIFISGDSGDDF